MKTKVQKWGNSLALRIPKSFAAEMSLKPDTEVDLSLVEGKLVVTPVIQPQYSLEQLLGDVTEENIHAEVDTGVAVGNEASMCPSVATPYGWTLALKQAMSEGVGVQLWFYRLLLITARFV